MKYDGDSLRIRNGERSAKGASKTRGFFLRGSEGRTDVRAPSWDASRSDVSGERTMDDEMAEVTPHAGHDAHGVGGPQRFGSERGRGKIFCQGWLTRRGQFAYNRVS